MKIDRELFVWTDAWLLLALLYSGFPSDRKRIEVVGDGINHAIFTEQELNGGLKRLIACCHVVENIGLYSPAEAVDVWYRTVSPKRSSMSKDLERVCKFLNVSEKA